MVILHELGDRPWEMAFAEWDHPVETFVPD